MRYHLLPLLLLFLAQPVRAQPEDQFNSASVSQIEYTRVDRLVFDKASIFSGDEAEVAFNLIRLENLTSGQLVKGVEVTIQSQETQKVGGSIGLASTGSIFGVSTSATYQKIRESGYIFLRPEDLDRVVSFLNEVIGAIGREQSEYKVYKLSLQKGFELGMLHDPDATSSSSTDDRRERPKWSFFVTTGEATYQLDYQDGLDAVRTLSNWQKQLSE